MQLFRSPLVFLLAASSLVSAAPDILSTEPQVLVRRSRYENGERRSVPEIIAATAMKYGTPISDNLAAAVVRAREARKAKRNTNNGRILGRVDLDGAGAVSQPQTGDTKYLTPVQIGTPPQTVMLDFDSGSCDLWVMSNHTPAAQIHGQTIYKPGESKTANRVKGATWLATYGDKSASKGVVYTDRVAVGDIVAPEMSVEAAELVSESFQEDAATDGLLGLAFEKLNGVRPNKVPSFFETVIKSLKAPIFSVDLKHDLNSTYRFGSMDTAAFTPPMMFTPVNATRGYWGFDSPGFSVGTGKMIEAKVTGIADTGTSLLLLPSDVVATYYKKVKSATFDTQSGSWVFPCASEMPDFSFAIGTQGGKITVPGAYMKFEEDAATKYCLGGMQPDTDVGIPIFGDVALKAAYVVFDRGNMQLGWANKKLAT